VVTISPPDLSLLSDPLVSKISIRLKVSFRRLFLERVTSRENFFSYLLSKAVAGSIQNLLNFLIGLTAKSSFCTKAFVRDSLARATHVWSSKVKKAKLLDSLVKFFKAIFQKRNLLENRSMVLEQLQQSSQEHRCQRTWIQSIQLPDQSFNQGLETQFCSHYSSHSRSSKLNHNGFLPCLCGALYSRWESPQPEHTIFLVEDLQGLPFLNSPFGVFWTSNSLIFLV